MFFDLADFQILFWTFSHLYKCSWKMSLSAHRCLHEEREEKPLLMVIKHNCIHKLYCIVFHYVKCECLLKTVLSFVYVQCTLIQFRKLENHPFVYFPFLKFFLHLIFLFKLCPQRQRPLLSGCLLQCFVSLRPRV